MAASRKWYRIVSGLVALAVICSALAASPARQVHADGPKKVTLFRADFEHEAPGPVTGTLPVEVGEVVPVEGDIWLVRDRSRALALDGADGRATAQLQWLNFPGTLPVTPTRQLPLHISAELASGFVLVGGEHDAQPLNDTSALTSTAGASFGLFSTGPVSPTNPGPYPVPTAMPTPTPGSGNFFEFFRFGPNGQLTRNGNPLGLHYRPGEKVRLDTQIYIRGGKLQARITLGLPGGRRTIETNLPAAFSIANLNQLRFQTLAGTGISTLDKVSVRLERAKDDDDPPAIIIIGDDDIEWDFEDIDGIIFINISITIINTGGKAHRAFLVFDLDDFEDLFDLAEVGFLQGVGFVSKIEGGKVYIGLGQNNIIPSKGENGKLKVKIRFKAKAKLEVDVRISARFRLVFDDTSGPQEIEAPPVTIVVPVVVVVVPVVVVQRLPIERIDVRFRLVWQGRGGLAIFGLPLTDAIRLPSGIIVQYFERARLEYHPELDRVLLGLLAVELGFRAPPTAAPTDTAELDWYFPGTGQLLGQPFRGYWSERGGLELFGLPISAVVVENGRQVQYFERARLELHPEHAGTPYEVELGLLGEQVLQAQGVPQSE